MAVFIAKLRVVGSFVEEVTERGLKVSQRLLCWHARDFVQPLRFRLFLQQGQGGTRGFVEHTFPFGVVTIGTQFQAPVVHITASAECACKRFSLLIAGVKPELKPKLHRNIVPPT